MYIDAVVKTLIRGILLSFVLATKIKFHSCSAKQGLQLAEVVFTEPQGWMEVPKPRGF